MAPALLIVEVRMPAAPLNLTPGSCFPTNSKCHNEEMAQEQFLILIMPHIKEYGVFELRWRKGLIPSCQEQLDQVSPKIAL